ncbi:DUF2680 domain-containing protein [Candidatus Contubernalis alkaliaceticus]|uniref:DUF2680 domain-containing protein n=1 Tax=Candidatus Contubernalis alkaliaceticus TaxID=338645 RepID=UPI001F4C2658|nr:DUF2680 domain-containing protein [Candidatus Contubernalis alkalaceticus]UNC91044.1 DUF2680 domain-containing protein [Candidatus Contubernalis alkalaceticus]
MKTNKVLGSICVVVLVAILGVGAAFAAPAESTIDTTESVICDRMAKWERTALTDEQREEMEARKASMEATQEKWTQLTDKQKEEIYALREKAADIDSQIIDKYLQWDLLDEEMAALMKERLSEGMFMMRENDRMPMPGGRGAHGRGGFKGAPPAEATTE